MLSEDPSGLGVRVSGRRDGRGVPFLLTHARVGSPPRDGVAFPALRPGSLVRVTHAHPVWRRGADAESVDEDEPDEEFETRRSSLLVFEGDGAVTQFQVRAQPSSCSPPFPGMVAIWGSLPGPNPSTLSPPNVSCDEHNEE